MELSKNATSTVYELQVENELQIVTGEEETVSIELLSGFAEIFGSELAQNTTYIFPPNTSVSIYSWKGCSIKVSGDAVESCVTSNSLIMISVNIHACLEEHRIIAESKFEKGPVSLVVGSAQSGKSTFCRFLLNYAARMGRKPLYIDLDLLQNRSSMPGMMSMCKIDQPSHITEGFSRQDFVSYLFGHIHPRENIALYYSLIKQMGKIVRKRFRKEKSNMYSSGIIIDTFTCTKQNDYHAIPFQAKAFNVDVIFVLDDKELFRSLKKNKPSNLKIVFVPRQNGVIEYTETQKKQNRQNLIWQYFYGTIQNPLTPHAFDVKFSDIEIYSAENRGEMDNIDIKKINIVKVSLKQRHVNSILGISYADAVTPNLLSTSVIGFICITRIKMKKEKVTVLSPQPAPLPGRILIYSSIKFKKEICTFSH